jgi:hypothetical protein
MKAYGVVEVSRRTFLTSALGGCGPWSSRPGRFTPGNRTIGTIWIGLVGPRVGLNAMAKRKEPLPLPGMDPGLVTTLTELSGLLKYPFPYRESNPYLPSRSSVTILTELYPPFLKVLNSPVYFILCIFIHVTYTKWDVLKSVTKAPYAYYSHSL